MYKTQLLGVGKCLLLNLFRVKIYKIVTETQKYFQYVAIVIKYLKNPFCYNWYTTILQFTRGKTRERKKTCPTNANLYRSKF
jgi:hypothetical protein